MKNLSKTLLMVALVFTATTVFVGCNKDRSTTDVRDRDRRGTGGTFGDNGGEFMETDRVWSAVGRTQNGGVEVILDLYATGGSAGNGGLFGNYYNGFLDGEGQMNVDGGIASFSGCNIRDGFYNLIVEAEGYMDESGFVREMRIRAEGPQTYFFFVNYMTVQTPQPNLRGCDGIDYQQEILGQWVMEGCGDLVGFVGGPQPYRCF